MAEISNGAFAALRLLVGAAVLGFSSLAKADLRSEFEIGRNLFSNGHYEKAAQVFESLLAGPVDPRAIDARKRRETIQAARPLHAASLIALGRVADADSVILDQLRDDPFYEPPAGQLPEPVVQRFISVGVAHADELEELRQQVLRERREAVARELREQEEARRQVDRLRRLAEEETLVTRRSRLIAMAPFGVGQFQNGNVGLGVFFAASQLTGMVASFATSLAAQHVAATDCRVADCAAAARSFEAFRVANWVTVGTTVALVTAGIVQAQVSLVPEERATRKRVGLRAVPTFGVGPSEGSVGLLVTF